MNSLNSLKIMAQEVLTEPIALIFLIISFLGVFYCIYLFFISHYLLRKIEKGGPIDDLGDFTGFLFVPKNINRKKGF